MRSNRSLFVPGMLGLVAALAAAGCAQKEPPAPVVASPAATPASANGGKIPVTTGSADAKAEFLQGRDLAEKLVITDSIAHFQKAVSIDPGFAIA